MLDQALVEQDLSLGKRDKFLRWVYPLGTFSIHIYSDPSETRILPLNYFFVIRSNIPEVCLVFRVDE